MIILCKGEKIDGEMVVAYFETLPRHSLRRAFENQEKCQSA
jgi:hypothetical protein